MFKGSMSIHTTPTLQQINSLTLDLNTIKLLI